MIVVKYFDESDKYAKIIPRTTSHILKRRSSQPPTREQVEGLKNVTGNDLMSLIKQDQSDWMTKYNPITSVLLYDVVQNKFNQVQENQEFDIPKQENIFVFHIKRRVPVERILGQSTMTFSVSEAADSWLKDAYERVLSNNPFVYQIRYYDIFHHGYTRLYQDDHIPTGRTGNSMVKILMEKIQQEAIVQQDQFIKLQSR
ncbi:UBP11, partial [Acrasis kona]